MEITNADIAKMTPEQRMALGGKPVAQVTVGPGGTISANGAPAVDRFRMIMILSALKLEAETGMKMTSRKKAPSPLKIIREQFGIKAKNMMDGYKKFKAALVEFGVILTDAERKRFADKEEKPGA